MANTVRRVYFGASGLYVAYKIANYFMGNGGDKKEEEKDPVQEFADSIQGASAQAMWLNLVGIGDELGLFQAASPAETPKTPGDPYGNLSMALDA